MRRGLLQVPWSPLAAAVAGLWCVAPVWAQIAPPLPWGQGVRAEAMPGGLRLNGLPVAAWRIEAADPAALARAVADRWRREGSEVHASRHDGREVVARVAEGLSEALQWRAGDHTALFSRMALQAPRGQAPLPRVPLPRGCHVLSTVEAGAGSGFLQLGGRCDLPAATVAARLRAAAQAAGLAEVASQLPGGLAFAHGPVRVQWLLRSSARGGAATFVLLESGGVP